jgi:NB-ARC domain
MLSFCSTEVKEHFDTCFWLFPQIQLDTTCLFRPIDILRKMLLKLRVISSSDAYDGYHHIMSELRQSLKEKRCLVIIDKNWGELWTLLNAVFPDGNNGSRVLITSEKQGHSDYIYELPLVNYQDSLKLMTKELGKKRFPEFEEHSDSSWADSPTNSVFFSSQSQNDSILPNNGGKSEWYLILPSVLKTCISYTAAVFPCGSIIHAESLIRLWIVEGFIPHEEGRTMENIAESFLDIFVQRYFVN